MQASRRGQEELFRHDGATYVQLKTEYQGNRQRIGKIFKLNETNIETDFYNISAQIATSDPMRSGSVDEKGEDEEDAEDDDKENMYEEAFAKMKRAAGVSEIEEVVHR